ncbi:glycine-rich domain-containing protein [Serratia sp. PAMC26656]|uniref:glycine-rich domain-containing protein n=1 Tax=Serratia sp. PAMC26656 TaxID=2775909 RepID=UPI0018F330EB|nr:phage tail protein [Serratia sp. PAMC26656]MBJ7894148.1 phage tail protein [Serratia sp. PAMC26656]
MQKVGSTTDTADINGEWTNGNVAQGEPPTILNAEILNTYQRELVNIVVSAGYDLDPNDDSQVLKALNKIFGTGRLLNIQKFNSSGLYIPTVGTESYIVAIIGAGGGSAAAPATGANEVSISCGGGAGAYAKGKFNNDGINKTVTIGAGGAGGTAENIYASDGGASSFGTLVVAPGGKAGLPAGPASPPFQPVANTTSDNPTGGNLISAPGSSASPAVAVSNSYAIGSAGASSFFGGGGWVVAINTSAAAGQAPGSGAGGTSRGSGGAAVAGATGADGMAIIWEYS